MRRVIRINPDYEYLRPEIEQLPDCGIKVEKIYCRKRNIVTAGRLDTLSVVVKKFKRPNFINSIVYGRWRPTKADRSFDNASRLLASGIDTPVPVAVITDYYGGRLRDSHYISILTDASPIAEYITEEMRPEMDKLFATDPMLRDFFDFACRLFSMGIYQRDFNRGNFLAIKDKNERWSFSMVDINRLKYGTVTAEMVAMAWVRFGCDTCPGLVEKLTVAAGIGLGLSEEECRVRARQAVERGARIERGRQCKRRWRRKLSTLRNRS